MGWQPCGGCGPCTDCVSHNDYTITITGNVNPPLNTTFTLSIVSSYLWQASLAAGTGPCWSGSGATDYWQLYRKVCTDGGVNECWWLLVLFGATSACTPYGEIGTKPPCSVDGDAGTGTVPIAIFGFQDTGGLWDCQSTKAFALLWELTFNGGSTLNWAASIDVVPA